MRRAALAPVLLLGCGVEAAGIPVPENASAAPYFQGTAPDDFWLTGARGVDGGGSHTHWDGTAWREITPVNTDWDGGPGDLAETQWAVAGPGLLVVTEYNGQIFTLDTDGARTDLGEPLDEPYAASFSVTGYDGVVYAYQRFSSSVPEGTSPLFRNDGSGWTVMPAPPGVAAVGVEDGSSILAVGPDVVWLFGNDGCAVFDGAAWSHYPGVYAGGRQGWLPMGGTAIAAISLDAWGYWRFDAEVAQQIPLEDPVEDAFEPRWPAAMRKDGDGLEAVLYTAVDTTQGSGTRWRVTVEAWEVDGDGYAGPHERIGGWTHKGTSPDPGPPSYLADGTTIVPFVDGLHVWEPR